jgi:serine/threonine protein kinase
MSSHNKDDSPSSAGPSSEGNIDSSDHEQSAAKTPAALLPRKRHATKSPVPPGSLESADEALDASSFSPGDCIDNAEGNSLLNRNLHSTFDSINEDTVEEDTSEVDVTECGDIAIKQSQHQSESPFRAGKQTIDESKAARRPSGELDDSMMSQSPHRLQQQIPVSQQQLQQQKPSGEPQTPMRKSGATKPKRYRQSAETLFSPKPMNWRRGSDSTTPSAADRRPPRPGSQPGADFTQSPEVSQDMPNESYNTSNTTSGSGYESSPATPFRFHAFPASLPRVHSKNDGSDGGSFSLTPFRLGESIDNSQQTGDTKYLRPKPTPPLYASLPTRQPLPPLSPATRKLFDANRENARQPLPMAPSFETVDEEKDYDISGDWSDSGMISTNERMKMAPNTATSIPSHVTSHAKMPGDDHDEVDTVMEGDGIGLGSDRYLDTKMPAENTESMQMESRLNVNLFYSPPQDSELSHPSTEKSNNQSQSALETTLHPHTPRSLTAEQFNIHNLEMSPIIRRSEDDGSLDEVESFKGRMEREDSQQQLFRDDTSSRSHQKDANTSAVSSTSVLSAGNATATSASTANVNNTTTISNISSSTRPQTRKIRPMPDTSAFDMSTPGSRDSGATSHKTAASGLLCPPTPIRTPAWAHAEGRPTFQRSNSLISTKVLAACPPRVLDNLSSLEDSMLENDISGMNSTFAPVDEKDEEDSFENEGMLFPLNENFDEHNMSPKTETGSTGGDTVMFDHSDGIDAMANNDRFSLGEHDLGSVSFSSFVNLGVLGSGAFADVYKVRSKHNQKCYAIKRTRRQFRGVKDRERAMAEVQTMQRLQADLESLSASTAHDKGNTNATDHTKSSYGLYLLFFIRAWQEDGYFFCQTELCCRATCRQLRLSLTSDWTRDVAKYPSLSTCLEPGADELKRLLPERAIWQVCHDISRGLCHIHSHGMVHYDIKPSNIFFVSNIRLGTICKIGDFGLAGDIGTVDDGQEGDTAYMPNELLTSCAKHPGADIFSLGLTLYELAAAVSWSLPREGDRWHDLRNGSHKPNVPDSRSKSLIALIQSMLNPDPSMRPSAEAVSEHVDVKPASALSDSFLSQYVKDVERYDSMRERDMESAEREARRR